MKKTIIVVLIASALYAAAVNMKAKGTSSGAERGFTRRIGGVYGYLPNSPRYYKQSVPEKWTCCKGKPCAQHCRKLKMKRGYPEKCPWQHSMKQQMRGSHMHGKKHCPMMQKRGMGMMGKKPACNCPRREGW